MAWIWPEARGQIQTSVQAGGMARARMRPLTNPMKMNGCAMVLLNPPAGAAAAASEICGWAAERLGDAGARTEVWMAGAEHAG